MVIEARERTGWVNRWAELGPKYQTVVTYVDRFKDPNLSPDRRATASQIIRGELDRTLSDSLPIPTVTHGPMGRLRNRGIRCGRINIIGSNEQGTITGEAVYLKGLGFAVFGGVRSSHPLTLETEGKNVIGDSLLYRLKAWQIRDLAKRVLIEVAKMRAA